MQGPCGEDGNYSAIEAVVQVAKVTRPLFSVGKMCDKGYDVGFTKTHAAVRDSGGAEVCRFERKNGLYVAKMRLRSPRRQGFHRQGGH